MADMMTETNEELLRKLITFALPPIARKDVETCDLALAAVQQVLDLVETKSKLASSIGQQVHLHTNVEWMLLTFLQARTMVLCIKQGVSMEETLDRMRARAKHRFKDALDLGMQVLVDRGLIIKEKKDDDHSTGE